MDQSREKSSGEKNGQNSTPVLQRAIYRMSSIRNTALQIPHPSHQKSHYSPSYHTPGSPTIRKHASSEYLSQPLLGESKFFSGNAQDADEAEVGHGKSKRRFRMPKSFAILLFLLACFVIIGVIFGIVSSQVFLKRGYFQQTTTPTTSSPLIPQGPQDPQGPQIPVDAAPVVMFSAPGPQNSAFNSPVAMSPPNSNTASNAVNVPVVFPVAPPIATFSANSGPVSIQDQELSNLVEVLKMPGPLRKIA